MTVIDETSPKDIDLVGFGALSIRETREALNDLSIQVLALGTEIEERKGFNLFTAKSSGVYSDINLGVLKISRGVINIKNSILKIETSPQTVNIVSSLAASRWYITYCDNAGVVTLEDTGASDYSTFPLSELNTLCPVETKGVARYKAGDSTKRALGIAFSLPTQTAWNSGTAYVRGNTCSYNGKVYASIQAGTNNQPDTYPAYWVEMGNEGYLFSPKIYNFPEETFGSGCLGDVTLDGTGAGATATPLYGLRENVTGTIEEYPEYEFNNLTISGTVYCGKNDGLSLDPVVIRVKGTLTIESGGQLNGDARGANGGAGGAAGGTDVSKGGAGGAGAKSGRPIHIFANRIINKRTSGYWVTCQAGDASSGDDSVYGTGGGGGGGAGSSSGLIIITNTKNIFGYNSIVNGKPGNGGRHSYSGGGGGAGAPYADKITKLAYGGKISNSNSYGPFATTSGAYFSGDGGSAYENGGDGTTYSNTYRGGVGGLCGEKGGGGGGGGHALISTSGKSGGNGGAAGGGGGSAIYPGAVGASNFGGGGGGGAGGTAPAPEAGANPVIPHDDLGYVIVIDSYSSRFAI